MSYLSFCIHTTIVPVRDVFFATTKSPIYIKDLLHVFSQFWTVHSQDTKFLYLGKTSPIKISTSNIEMFPVEVNK
jgi:AAA15 family ATPase/GTPase